MQRSFLARGAAVLALALLAACQDNPVVPEPGVQPRDLGALHALAPVLTVSNSGGYPLISWSALAGATSYSVVLVETYIQTNRLTVESNSWSYNVPLGSTTGTSILDSSHPYTGVSRCSYLAYPSVTRVMFSYHVTATFADGSSTGWVQAPVGQC